MSATDELRRMLDERGVEHGGSDAVVYFEDERGYKACAYDAPRRFGEGVLCVTHTATPEQAIAATLGDGTCLPHFWTHDGTLHVELPKLPESISVRLPDQRDREVGSARVWQYTLGNDGVGRTNDGLADLQADNAKLREEDERFIIKLNAEHIVRQNVESENAKLREDMEDLEGYDQMLRDRLRQETELRVKAEAENAKLRELVDYMTPIALYAASERERDRMRELGVEVDG